MVDWVVPAVQDWALEPVAGRGALDPAVPPANQPERPAGLVQRAGKRELPVGQVLEVADVALVVASSLCRNGAAPVQRGVCTTSLPYAPIVDTEC